MSDPESTDPRDPFGTGRFKFGEWVTPFTDARIEILEVVHSPIRPWPAGDAPHYRTNSLLREHDDNDLVARIYAYDAKAIYRVKFASISAMRLLDEGGLAELWEETEAFGGRPGQTTFRVRNHAWTSESVLSFIETGGWSFVIASANECLEVVSSVAAIIVKESDALQR
jgi:hypothetical protein